MKTKREGDSPVPSGQQQPKSKTRAANTPTETFQQLVRFVELLLKHESTPVKAVQDAATLCIMTRKVAIALETPLAAGDFASAERAIDEALRPKRLPERWETALLARSFSAEPKDQRDLDIGTKAEDSELIEWLKENGTTKDQFKDLPELLELLGEDADIEESILWRKKVPAWYCREFLVKRRKQRTAQTKTKRLSK